MKNKEELLKDFNEAIEHKDFDSAAGILRRSDITRYIMEKNQYQHSELLDRVARGGHQPCIQAVLTWLNECILWDVTYEIVLKAFARLAGNEEAQGGEKIQGDEKGLHLLITEADKVIEKTPFFAPFKEISMIASLHQAIEKGNVKEVEEYIKTGKSLNYTLRGITPIFCAIKYNQLEILQKLIEAGADINQQDMAGYSPLHYAIYNEQFKCVSLLLKQKGIITNTRTHQSGETPFRRPEGIAKEIKTESIERIKKMKPEGEEMQPECFEAKIVDNLREGSKSKPAESTKISAKNIFSKSSKMGGGPESLAESPTYERR